MVIGVVRPKPGETAAAEPPALNPRDRAALIMAVLNHPAGISAPGGGADRLVGVPPQQVASLVADLRQALGEKTPAAVAPIAPTQPGGTEKPLRPKAAASVASPVVMPMKAMTGSSSDVLAAALAGEHPAFAARLVSGLPSDKVAAILRRMPPRKAQRLAVSLTRLSQGAPSLGDDIQTALGEWPHWMQND